MDLLFVYVDKEIKHGEVEVARRLFERTMNPPSGKKKFKFNDKQMKSLFKKWYRMEDEHGDEDSTMRVKLAAKEYVERSSK
jgi:rRNA biogenesis protein RRP5